jgi:hypothetical protein
MMEMRGLTNQEQLPIEELIQIWREDPFDLSEGSQILENLRLGSRKSSGETFYKRFRRAIIDHHPDEKVTWVFEGPSGSGKSSAAQAVRRLLASDLYLKSQLDFQQRHLKIDTVLYGEALLAAQLPVFTEQGEVAYQIGASNVPLRRLIESGKQMGTFQRKEYAIASNLTWDQLNKFILNNTDPKVANVVLIEANIDSGYPVIKGGVLKKILGRDRGTSVLAKLALDPRTSRRLHVTAFERDMYVFGETIRARTEAEIPHLNLERIQSGQEVIYILTDEGEYIDLRRYPAWFQIKVIEFKNRISNSPDGIRVADTQIKFNWENVSNRLGLKKKKRITSAKQWHAILLQDTLNIPPQRWKTATNEHLEGTIREFDTAYLINNSLIVAQFPMLWD